MQKTKTTDEFILRVTVTFNYYPLVWLCHDRSVNNKINRLNERCLRIVYSDSVSSYEDLLDKDRSVSVHAKNIKTPSIEMFNVSNKLTALLMNEIFVKRNNAYNLRKPSEFVRPTVFFMVKRAFHTLALRYGI